MSKKYSKYIFIFPSYLKAVVNVQHFTDREWELYKSIYIVITSDLLYFFKMKALRHRDENSKVRFRSPGNNI